MSDRAIFGTLPHWEGLLEIFKKDLWVINAKGTAEGCPLVGRS